MLPLKVNGHDGMGEALGLGILDRAEHTKHAQTQGDRAEHGNEEACHAEVIADQGVLPQRGGLAHYHAPCSWLQQYCIGISDSPVSGRAED